MGLFDGFEAGWNSFKNNELKAITKAAEDTGKVLISPSPIVKAITNPTKIWEDPASLLPIEIGSSGPVVKDVEEQWKEVGDDYEDRVKKNVDILTSPNPLISAATGNVDDIFSDKPAAEKWGDVVSPIENVVKDSGETVKKTVTETIGNVTKGFSEALPVLAIGGAAVLLVSLLLGRR